MSRTTGEACPLRISSSNMVGRQDGDREQQRTHRDACESLDEEFPAAIGCDIRHHVKSSLGDGSEHRALLRKMQRPGVDFARLRATRVVADGKAAGSPGPHRIIGGARIWPKVARVAWRPKCLAKAGLARWGFGAISGYDKTQSTSRAAAGWSPMHVGPQTIRRCAPVRHEVDTCAGGK